MPKANSNFDNRFSFTSFMNPVSNFSRSWTHGIDGHANAHAQTSMSLPFLKTVCKPEVRKNEKKQEKIKRGEKHLAEEDK